MRLSLVKQKLGSVLRTMPGRAICSPGPGRTVTDGLGGEARRLPPTHTQHAVSCEKGWSLPTLVLSDQPNPEDRLPHTHQPLHLPGYHSQGLQGKCQSANEKVRLWLQWVGLTRCPAAAPGKSTVATGDRRLAEMPKGSHHCAFRKGASMYAGSSQVTPCPD